MTFDQSHFALGRCDENELKILYSNDSISAIENETKKPKRDNPRTYETGKDFKKIKDNIVLDNNDFLSYDSEYENTICKYYSVEQFHENIHNFKILMYIITT